MLDSIGEVAVLATAPTKTFLVVDADERPLLKIGHISEMPKNLLAIMARHRTRGIHRGVKIWLGHFHHISGIACVRRGEGRAKKSANSGQVREARACVNQ